MQTRNQDVIKALVELLAIAKVAMPDFLYDIDPRVQSALRLLTEIEHPSHSRPPDLRREPPIEMVDITPPPHPGPAAPPTPWDISEGLDAFMASPEAPLTRSEAVVLILREWLTANGHLQPPPATEQQH
jgi:hypothetical protein